MFVILLGQTLRRILLFFSELVLSSTIFLLHSDMGSFNLGREIKKSRLAEHLLWQYSEWDCRAVSSLPIYYCKACLFSALQLWFHHSIWSWIFKSFAWERYIQLASSETASIFLDNFVLLKWSGSSNSNEWNSLSYRSSSAAIKIQMVWIA